MPVVHVARLLRLANRREPGDAPVRNLPMPLQKTQISTISFGHSLGTGRTGVRPAPDVPRGCPPHSFLRQEGPANPSAANFPQSAVLRLLPTRETLAQQYACWRRRIPLRDGAQCDRAYVATGGLHTFVRAQRRRRACAQ